MEFHKLNKREREILSILYQIGEGSVQEVVDKIEDAPSYNAIRVTMYLLENKGFLTHHKEGVKHIFKPTQAKTEVGSSVLDHILKTFFEGSVPNLINSLVSAQSKQLSKEELNELAKLIDRKKKENSEK